MNKFVLGAWALCFSLGMGFGLTGCGDDPCGEYKQRCEDECPSEIVSICTAVADAFNQAGGDGDRACEQALQNFSCEVTGD